MPPTFTRKKTTLKSKLIKVLFKINTYYPIPYSCGETVKEKYKTNINKIIQIRLTRMYKNKNCKSNNKSDKDTLINHKTKYNKQKLYLYYVILTIIQFNF